MGNDDVKKLVGTGKNSRTILCAAEACLALEFYLNNSVYRADRQVKVEKVMKRGDQLVVEFVPKPQEMVEREGFLTIRQPDKADVRPPLTTPKALEPVLTGEYRCDVCGDPITARDSAISGRCSKHQRG